MSRRRPGSRATAQLSLFEVRANQEETELALLKKPKPALPTELTGYQEALVQHLSLSPHTAEVQSRHLAAMVRSAGVGTVQALASDGLLAVEAIRSAPRLRTRRARHLAVQDYLDLCGGSLDPLAVKATRTAIESLFPGRTTPHPALVDRHLGGSLKEVRRRPPFGWLDGARLIEAARSGRGQSEPLRDAALLALHVRSGLPSTLALQVEWQLIMPLMNLRGELYWYPVDIRGQRYELAIHDEAVDALRRWWQVCGMPHSGPVFITSRRPARRLSASQANEIVRATCLAAGLPVIDRRRLRAVFASWFLSRGWGRRAVADAFGYGRVRELDELVRHVDEALSQERLNEVLVMTDAEAEVSSQTPDSLLDLQMDHRY